MNSDVRKTDELAKKRTHLANERTFLAYIRTALALVGLGLFLIKYEPTDFSSILGIICVIFALTATFIGGIKYFSNQHKFRKL